MSKIHLTSGHPGAQTDGYTELPVLKSSYLEVAMLLDIGFTTNACKLKFDIEQVTWGQKMYCFKKKTKYLLLLKKTVIMKNDNLKLSLLSQISTC